MAIEVTQAPAFGLHRLRGLWRFYQAGVLNTLFGFGVYALLVRLGLNLYRAQIIAQLLGMTFNYFTYSQHVFRDFKPEKARFIGAYAFNYLISLAFLAFFDVFLRSPYVAGMLATICASLANYFVLKRVVFVSSDAA